MTTLTNEQMLNNVITILNKMKIMEEDDFKKEMNKVIKNAMKDNTIVKNRIIDDPRLLDPLLTYALKYEMTEVEIEAMGTGQDGFFDELYQYYQNLYTDHWEHAREDDGPFSLQLQLHGKLHLYDKYDDDKGILHQLFAQYLNAVMQYKPKSMFAFNRVSRNAITAYLQADHKKEILKNLSTLMDVLVKKFKAIKEQAQREYTELMQDFFPEEDANELWDNVYFKECRAEIYEAQKKWRLMVENEVLNEVLK